MFAVRDSAQGLTVYMIYTLIIVKADHAGIDLEILKGRQEKEITVFGRDFNEYAGALFV